MAWIKVESSVSRNRKFVKAGPAASWLWVCGLAYCQEGLTDGFIPTEALDFLGVKHARRLSLQLEVARLWDLVEGGWQVHDYLGHNKPASEVRRLQDERRTAGAQGGKASGESRRAEATAKQPAEATAKQPAEATAKQPANPAVPESSKAEQSRAVARPSPTIQRRRKDAAFEYGRLYVPQRAHDDLVMFANHGTNERTLFDWYEAVCEEYTNGSKMQTALPTDLIAFWKSRYAERWPAEDVPALTSKQPAWIAAARAKP